MKKLIDFLLRMKLIVIGIVLYGILLLVDRALLFTALAYLKSFIIEMAQILPLVFLIAALITEWIPAVLIERHLGKKSGVKGVLFSLLLGSVSAGPIYAAFPMAHSLHKKGASVRNIVILISAWATIKIPMLMVEARFLSVPFMLARYLLTIPAIIIMGVVISKWKGIKIPARIEGFDAGEEGGRDNMVVSEETKRTERLLELLPGRNCGACGFPSCGELALAVSSESELRKKCVFL